MFLYIFAFVIVYVYLADKELIKVDELLLQVQQIRELNLQTGCVGIQEGHVRNSAKQVKKYDNRNRRWCAWNMQY